MSTERINQVFQERLCKLARDVERLGVCSSGDVKLVLFATEGRFGHLVSRQLVPGWRLISHCNIAYPGLLAGYIFSRKVIRLIGGEAEDPWNAWSPPEIRWPERADFKSRERSCRYLRIELATERRLSSSAEKCVLFVNICDPSARERLQAKKRRIEELAAACLADCVALFLEDPGTDQDLENYSAITRMIAPVTRSDDHGEDLHKVFDFYLENILAEIRRRRRRDGLEFGEDDLHSSIHSNNLLGSKAAKSEDGVLHCTVVEAHAPGHLNVRKSQPLPWTYDIESKNRQAGFVAFALTFGQALLFRDLTDQGEGAEEWRRLYRQVALSGASSAAVAPIFLEEGKLWGALNLESTKPGAFRQEDMFFLLICVRLLAVQIEQFLESRRNENQKHLLPLLSMASLVDRNGPRTTSTVEESVATRVAEMMCEQFRADQVIISPRCRTLWPIFEPVVWPGLDELPFTIRKNGYTRWLTKNARKHQANGVWVTRGAGDSVPSEVRKFRAGGDRAKFEGDAGSPSEKDKSLLGREDIENDCCAWAINPEDSEFNTLVGLAVPTGGKDGDEPGEKSSKRKIGAVVWVKNRTTLPYSSIRAIELAQMAKWLEAFLTLHEDFNMERAFERPVFTRGALESYLQRAKNGRPEACPNVMALLDIDNFRWVNAMCGYAEGTRVIKEVLRCMAEAAREVERRYEGEGHRSNIYFDIYRYGGDEFVVLCRLGRAGSDVKRANAVAFRLFEQWDRATREKLKIVDIKPQKEGAVAKKGVTFSLGVTKNLPELIQNVGVGRDGDKDGGCTEKLVRFLGASVRIAKKGQGAFDKTVVFEEVKDLIQQSLPETRKEALGGMAVVKVLVGDQRVVIDVGENHNVRPGMGFQVLHDNRIDGRGLFTDGQDLPKADLEITDVWSDYAQAKASRVSGTIEVGDRVIIRLE